MLHFLKKSFYFLIFFKSKNCGHKTHKYDKDFGGDEDDGVGGEDLVGEEVSPFSLNFLVGD